MRKIYIIAAAWLSMLLVGCSNGNSTGTGGKIADAGLSAAPPGNPAIHEPSSTGNTVNSVPEYSGPVYKVVIDPGHGGEDSGATSVSGRFEKDFNLSVCQAIAEKVEEDPQIQLELTRTSDSFISSHELYRPEFANTLPADLFISIHGNTFEDESASGTETFYYHEDSLAFAEIIHKHVVQATGLKDRGVKTENFYVLRETKMPSVLLELGYLTNPGDDAKMWTADFQESVASAVIDGIKEYLQLDE